MHALVAQKTLVEELAVNDQAMRCIQGRMYAHAKHKNGIKLRASSAYWLALHLSDNLKALTISIHEKNVPLLYSKASVHKLRAELIKYTRTTELPYGTRWRILSTAIL